MIEGLLVVDLAVHEDDRGWFKEAWQRARMTAEGLLMSAIATGTHQSLVDAAKAAKLDKAIEDISVTVTHVHDSTFERRIEITGDISEQQRAQLRSTARGAGIDPLIGHTHIVDVTP